MKATISLKLLAMLFTLKSPERVCKLIELFKVIKSLNNFCTMYCKPTGMFIQTMDDAHVSLMDITIEKDWFEHFESEEETISVNIKVLSTVLSLYTPNTEMSFTSSDDYLEISLKYDDRTEKSFELPRIDIDCDVMNSQDIDHSLEFSINTKKMDRYICDMQLFGDTMELVYVNEVIYMRSNGDDGKYCLKLTTDLVDDLIVEEDLKLMARVPLRFPAAVTKMSSVFEQIYIQISENAPFTFKMSDIVENDESEELMKIIYYVAPKIEDDDEFDFSEFEQEDDDCKNEIVG